MARGNNSQIHQTPVVIPLISSEEVRSKEDQDRRAARARVQAFGVDSFDASPDFSGVASSGEASPPTKACGTSEARIKETRFALEVALKKNGNQKKDGDLITSAEARLQDLDAQIQKAKADGEDPVLLKNMRAQVQKALNDYQAALTSVNDAPDAGQVSAAQEVATPSPELEQAWTSLEEELKVSGIKVETATRDVEKTHGEIKAYLTEQNKKYSQREKEIKAQLEDISKAKQSASPEKKKQLEAQEKVLKTELGSILAKKIELKQASLRLNGFLDAIQRHAIESELGSSERPATLRDKKEKSATEGQTVSSASAASASQAAKLQTNSMPSASLKPEKLGAETENRVPEVRVASREEDSETVLEGVSTLAIQSGSDFSGTTLAIQSTGSQMRSDERKTEDAIKKLLRAALSGNMEAVSQALILMDKRASQIVTGMGAATIKSMQGYEKQMSELNKKIAKLTGKEADYNSKLASLNSKMNQYSMNRQAIANFLQDTLRMREEIGNTTHGFISKMGQISSSLSRFG